MRDEVMCGFFFNYCLVES